MSKDNFLVKKSLAFLPQLSAPLNPLKGDVYKDSNLDLLQYNGSSWVKIGSGSGAGDLDTMHTEVFDDSALADFTITGVGVSLDSINPLNGTKSLKLIHQAAINQTVKKTIAVPLKYRGQAMTVAVLAKSAATIGNVTILFRDETNAIDLQSSQQIQADPTAKTFQFGVKIPSNCLSFSYTITALPEAGLVETFIDDVSIKSYWMGTASQGQTEYSFEQPIITEWQSYTPVFTGFGTVASINFRYRQNGSSYEIEGSAVCGTPTAVEARISLPNSALTDPSYTSLEVAGHFNSAGSTHGCTINVDLNNPHMNIGTAGGLLKSLGNAVASIGLLFSVDAKIRIAGLKATESKTFTTNDLVPAKAMNGSASIDSVIVTNQTLRYLNAGTVVAGTIVGALAEDSNTGVISYNSATGFYTASKKCVVAISGTCRSGSTGSYPGIRAYKVSNAVTTELFQDYPPAPGAGYTANGSATIELAVGDYVYAQVADTNSVGNTKVIVQATAYEIENKTWSSTQTLVQQETDSQLNARGNAGQVITAGTEAIPFAFNSLMGDAISYDGANVTFLKEGIYNICCGVIFVAVSDQRMSFNYTGGVQFFEHVDAGIATRMGSMTRYFYAGDTLSVRSNTAAGTLSNNTSYHYLTVTKQGSVKAIQTVSDQKIEIPTHSLRMAGTTTAKISNNIVFQNLERIKGDGLTVDNTNGTTITVQKDGLLDIHVTFLNGATAVSAFLLLNGSVVSSTTQQGGWYIHLNAAGIPVKAGDYLSINTPQPILASATIANFSATLQEQRVSVSVSNTLPQFSESDSYIRTNTQNGYGSTANKIRRFANIESNIGNAVEYSDSSVNGANFLIKENGTYHISYVDSFNAASQLAITKNQTNLTLVSSAVPIIERLATMTTGGADYEGNVFWSGPLVVGDIIRACTNGAGAGDGPASFSITKVGKPNVTGVDVTPFIEIPQPTTQSASYFSQATTTASTFTGDLTSNVGNGIYSYDSSTGLFTVLKKCTISLNSSIRATSTGVCVLYIFVNGLAVAVDYTGASANYAASASYNITLNPGEYFQFQFNAASRNYTSLSVLATALADQILTVPETFSTDTANLQYAPSSSYNITTLPNAPVGTCITYIYTANSNTRIQTTTPPTQSIQSMITDGIFLTPRAYNATGSAATPATFLIQIGKGLIGWKALAYGSAGKLSQANWNVFPGISGVNEYGVVVDYDPATGILVIDSGVCWNASTTVRHSSLNIFTGGSQTTAYMTVTASKNPALVGVNSNSVAARGVNSSGQIFGAVGSTMLYDSSKTFDTNGTLDVATGLFTSPESGYYQVNAGLDFLAAAYTGGQVTYITGKKNGATYSHGDTYRAATVSIAVKLTYNDLVYLAKGETFSIFVTNSRGNTTLNANADHNFFSIIKI